MPDILDGLSMNIEQSNLDKLRSVFPECVSEGKLDIDKLLSLCGEYIDNDFEKYKFEWKGKADCLRLAQKRSTGTLRPCQEESVDWDTTQNLYIEGDNLEVLKLLQTAYYRKVKMFYIDPPYNTGNDFVYADDFADPMARYKEVTQQTTKSNPETMGRFHTNWLNMMYPRLRLAANLLRDDGVIFISIDDNEVTNLRKVCDEVFGEENFIAQIIWQKRTSPDARRVISPGHEYILVYTKNIQNSNQVIKLLPFSEKDKAAYKNPDNDPRGPWISTDCTAQAGHGTKNQFYTMVTPAGRVIELPDSLCWRYTQDKMNEEIAAGRIWFGADGKGVPRKKTYLSERAGRNLWTWWPNTEVGHTQSAAQGLTKLFGGKIFDFSKPVELIQRCLAISTSNDDIILDFFSGSATTAHAVMQLNAEDGGNRRFILVQLPELCDEKSEAHKAGYKNICEIGKERIRRAGKKILEEHAQVTMEEDKQPLDVGFRVFKLDTSNLKTWDATPIEDEQLDLLYQRMNTMIHRVKPERTDLDMIYEIMLKLGVPLTYSVTPFSIHNKTVYGVGDDCLLLVCLAEDVQPEDVEQMTEYAPAKIIISRDSFADDTAMANAYYILRDHGIELKLV
ncbi:site-specific DNA-methyltransferase [Flavonifractor sp. An100]|uniref:site-specific DNA-methyltransferase n=1 Tax=Flavonifractor sp. An100 TaxID=1965538 RepID=UPI000B3A36D8|nr:site-specific DNA-methyltransferase [Flavonifractor sp. An100]OUQ81042.1 site-specific DNA-methyltransferase [Flavonifractor sp. An100]